MIGALLLAACEPLATPLEPPPVQTDVQTGPPVQTDPPSPVVTPGPPSDRADWIAVEGGTFEMGSNEHEQEQPIHTVTVPSFYAMRTEVTLPMYNDCEAEGLCTPRIEGTFCVTEGDDLPANCLDWFQAEQICTYLGGRRLTESEWEWLGTNGGVTTYPWGEEEPDCTRANYVDQDGVSCSSNVWPVCSRPAGTSPWGFCDLGGNIFEWLEDTYHPYDMHPTDGSAQTAFTDLRALRGGSIGSMQSLRSSARTYHVPEFVFGGLGVRCGADL